jgi:uncharacterized protein (DUF924 family)
LDEKQFSPVLQFWFGELDGSGLSSPTQQKRWFNPPDGMDEAIGQQFGPLVEQALQGGLHDWADSPPGRVALVILLDQFTRNIYRGTPRAFAGDVQALSLVRQTVREGLLAELPLIQRVLLCLPFEHAEDLAAQDEGLRRMDEILADCGQSALTRVQEFKRYMLAHREVIARFGRFPHRNAILRRRSTPEELAWLKEHGGF